MIRVSGICFKIPQHLKKSNIKNKKKYKWGRYMKNGETLIIVEANEYTGIYHILLPTLAYD